MLIWNIDGDRYDDTMGHMMLLYYLFLFSTAGLIVALMLLTDTAWLMPAFMMIGLILLTNIIEIVLKHNM